MLLEQASTTVKCGPTVLGSNLQFSPQCIHISQGGKCGCICVGEAWIQWEYIPGQLPKGAKRLRTAFGCNCDFCDFDSPRAGVRNCTKQAQCGLYSLRLYQYSRRLRGINECLHVGVATSEIVATHPGGEVGKPSSNHAESSRIPLHWWAY